MPTLNVLIQSPALLVLLCGAALFIGLSKGGLPGAGMLAVPLLSLSMSPVNAAVLLLPIFILSDVVAVWLYRKEFSKQNLLVLIPAGLIGVVLGWSTATMVSDAAVSLLIGLLGVTFCLYTWFGQTAQAQPREPGMARGLFWGSLSGFTSFVSHAGAPPYQVYVLPQKLPKMVFAGTTTILFAAVNLAKVVPYSALHPYSKQTLSVALLLVPAAIVGTVVGRLLIGIMPEKVFFTAVQIALFLICIQLIYRAVF